MSKGTLFSNQDFRRNNHAKHYDNFSTHCIYTFDIELYLKQPDNYTANPKTIGEHLCKKRVDRGFTQKQVAKIIGTDTTSINNWENNRFSPNISFFSKLINFIGYVPFEVKTETIGEKLLTFRKLNGLSQTKLASRIGIDRQTLAGWEKDMGKSSKIIATKIEEFIESIE